METTLFKIQMYLTPYFSSYRYYTQNSLKCYYFNNPLVGLIGGNFEVIQVVKPI